MRPETPRPFASLLAASSLVFAILFVAGFSYRWAYYYNFGLKHLVYELPIQSLVIGSLELIRSPSNALLTLAMVIVPFLAFTALLGTIRYALSKTPRLGVSVNWFRTYAGTDNEFITDALRALVLLCSALFAGSMIGYWNFVDHVTASRPHPLPLVTVVFDDTADAANSPLLCGSKQDQPLKAIGNLAGIASVRKFNRACSLNGRSWRLLHQSKEFVYLVSIEENAPVGRPLTFVLPNDKGFTLVLE